MKTAKTAIAIDGMTAIYPRIINPAPTTILGNIKLKPNGSKRLDPTPIPSHIFTSVSQ